ncbi:hypothetical protein T8J41_01975 [Nitratireductor rhodophyticola]|uniref:hypothetical protein n=1 Tax=Nitratireductor rhodophyticola TaxID=2854036 RepID=UPI002AC98CC7|nr:hypothetical protein [Nitratireductor rhodophyticola]WPZ14618.1 hypothetical protein T8J41_01975 [Nitratireductor rhodophyticola]
MDDYFYTLNLGPSYGPKLEALAAQASFDDVEAFAAVLLSHAVDAFEAFEADFEVETEDDENP